MLTKGAFGNLVNRYRAVLKKCNLINTFGSLAVASMLVLGGAGVASAVTIEGLYKDDAPSGKNSKGGAGYELNVDKPFTGYIFKNNGIKNSDRNEDGGGAIYSTKELTLTDCTFEGNYVQGAGHGGAIYINGGSLNVMDTTFSGNSNDNYGGAVAALGATSVTFSKTTFSGNSGANGGALYFRNSGNVVFDSCSFTGNISTGRGGAVQASYGTTLTLKGTNTFEGNEGGNGGAISVHYQPGSTGASNSIIFAEGSETIFKDNVASKSGGAIHCDNNLTFGAGSTVTFEGNSAARNGGAIANSTDDSSKADVSLPTTTFEGTVNFINNTAAGEGGAIYNPENGTVALNGDATFENNTAAGKKNDIQNDGVLEIGGTTTIDGGITGTGTIEGTSSDATIVFTSVDSKVEASKTTGVKAKASGDLNDAIGGSKKAFEEQMAASHGLEFAGMDEGKVFGAVDENGNMAKNTLMDAVVNQTSITTVALDKILTNDVRKRLGDIRSDKNETGMWMRWDGGKLKGENGLTNDFNTIQIGGDTKVGKNCRLGVAGSFTHGEAEFGRGNAELEGFTFSTYATWMGENGMFADVVARLGKFSNEMVVEGDKGDTDNRMFSLSGEYGWRLPVCDQFFLEPQVELAYTYVSSDTLELGDATYLIDNMDSLTGRVGLVAGWNLPDDMGNVYVRASVLHQFMGDSKITGSINGLTNVQKTDGDDSWLEYGIGANVKLTDKTYIWADMERTECADIDEEWRGTIGFRYSF